MMKHKVDISLRLLAASYISKQLAKLMMHLQGALTAKDIEDIHQARVACRRIRTALTLFGDCFEAADVRAWEKQIKKLLKAFGTARDLDVQIEFLEHVFKSLTPDQKKLAPGIRRMLLRWQQRRDKIQSNIIKTVNRVQKKHLLTNIHIHMERNLFVLKPQKPSLKSPPVYQRAYEQIQLHKKDFLAMQDCLFDPDDIAGHHAIRIAAKKLRYAMEIFDGALQGELKSSIKRIKRIQTILGDMHDCDVWDVDINHFIEQEKMITVEFYGHARPFLRVLPGLLYLQRERNHHREQLYCKVRDYFTKLKEDSFWEDFPDVLRPTESGDNKIDAKPIKDNSNEGADAQAGDSF